MGRKSYIKESDLSGFQNIHDVKVLESREDISTLLDIYRDVLSQGISPESIIGVKEDNEKHYFFVVGEKRVVFSLDIVTFINSKYPARKVTNSNIKLLFPEELSRGLYGEKRLRKPSVRNSSIPRLFYERDKLLITIPRDSKVVIGRSEKRCNFCITGNGDVSRSQCKVYYDKKTGAIRVEDCNSSNGTYVNSRKLQGGGTPLSIGDVISFAGEKFLVVK